MILTTPREIQVSKYLRANRRRLHPVVEARCRDDGRLLAAVYPLRDEFWVWHLGERYSPEQWRDEAETMMDTDPDSSGGETAICEGDADHSSIDARAAVRAFPEGIFQLRDPVGVYRSHTLEQVLTAYRSGPFSSCMKCRKTYVIDLLATGYLTGESVINGSRKRNIIHPARVSFCGDKGHNCDDHMTDEIPWNLAEACSIISSMLTSPRKAEYL